MKAIKHHARRVVHTAKRVRWHIWLILGVILAVGAIAAIMYFAESSRVRDQDPAHPLRCMELTFDDNIRRCEELLLLTYNSMSAHERGPLCDRSKDRSVFGTARSACRAYDEFLTEQLRNASLTEFGITVWEPDVNITGNGTLHARSLERARTVSLVCDGVLVPSTFEEEIDATLLAYNGTANGSCVLIATTGQGSVTSEKFLMNGLK
jgi:hypothetical protein